MYFRSAKAGQEFIIKSQNRDTTIGAQLIGLLTKEFRLCYLLRISGHSEISKVGAKITKIFSSGKSSKARNFLLIASCSLSDYGHFDTSRVEIGARKPEIDIVTFGDTKIQKILRKKQLCEKYTFVGSAHLVSKVAQGIGQH